MRTPTRCFPQVGKALVVAQPPPRTSATILQVASFNFAPGVLMMTRRARSRSAPPTFGGDSNDVQLDLFDPNRVPELRPPPNTPTPPPSSTAAHTPNEPPYVNETTPAIPISTPVPAANQAVPPPSRPSAGQIKRGAGPLLLFSAASTTILTIFTIFYSYNAAITQNPILPLLPNDSNATITMVNALVQSTLWFLSGLTDEVCECLKRSRASSQGALPLPDSESQALSPRVSPPKLIRLIASKQSTRSARYWAAQRLLLLSHVLIPKAPHRCLTVLYKLPVAVKYRGEIRVRFKVQLSTVSLYRGSTF
jgi:hypothetical protein